MRPLLALFLSASPLWAEPWIDYEMLLRDRADKVVLTTAEDGSETRTLMLDGGVTVSCSKDGCVGVDNGAGAVGCSWAIVSAVRATVEVCNLPDDGRIGRLKAIHARLSAFVAQNAVPPRPVSAIDDDYRTELERTRKALAAGTPESCATATAPGSDVMMMFEIMVADAPDGADWDAFLATPAFPS